MNVEELLQQYRIYVSELKVSRQTKDTFVAVAKNKLLPAFTVSEIKEMDADTIACSLSNSRSAQRHYRYYTRELQNFLRMVGA